MKNWVKNNWFKISLLVIIIIIIGGAFYWFQLRPTKIRNYCNQWALDKAGIPGEKRYNIGQYNDYFDRCLREQGLSN